MMGETVKLSENERKVLAVLIDGGGEESECGFFPFQSIKAAGALDLEVKQIRLACRSLKRKGMAAFCAGLWNDDGPAGAGYAATNAALQREDVK